MNKDSDKPENFRCTFIELLIVQQIKVTRQTSTQYDTLSLRQFSQVAMVDKHTEACFGSLKKGHFSYVKKAKKCPR